MQDILAGQRWEFVVTEAREFTDRGMGNASDWATFRTVPGVYPVTFTTSNFGTPFEGSEHGRGSRYWARTALTVQALASGGVNRLFTASSSFEHDHGGREETHTIQNYAYNFRPSSEFKADDWRTKNGRECPPEYAPGAVHVEAVSAHYFAAYGGTYRLAS